MRYSPIVEGGALVPAIIVDQSQKRNKSLHRELAVGQQESLYGRASCLHQEGERTLPKLVLGDQSVTLAGGWDPVTQRDYEEEDVHRH